MTESKTKEKENANDSAVLKIIDQVKASANYCYNCNRCVTVCPISHLGIFSPRDLINDISYLSIEEALENNNIWECLTCGQCSIYCPMTSDNVGVRIPELVLELRKVFGQDQSQIEKLLVCETHNGIFPLISQIMAENPHAPDKLSFINEADLKITDKGEVAYFVGCLPLMDDVLHDLNIQYTNSAITVISLLNGAGITPVVLNEKCCGHDILWARGDTETFKKLAEYNVNLYRKAGVKTIVLSCAEGYRTWKIDYPRIIDDFDFEVLHFSEFLLKEKILDNLRFPQENKVKVTYHDACRIGRLGGKLYDAPRKVLSKIPGVELIEMENIKDDAQCCGVSAFSCCNEYTRVIRQNRIQEAVNTGAEYLVVPCPKCLSHFNCYLSEPSLDETHQQLKEKIKVIDFATFLGQRLFLF
jgi:heterodisulfide reductase subunit D